MKQNNQAFLEFEIGNPLQHSLAKEEWEEKALPFLVSKAPQFLGREFDEGLLDDEESMDILKQAYSNENQSVKRKYWEIPKKTQLNSSF